MTYLVTFFHPFRATHNLFQLVNKHLKAQSGQEIETDNTADQLNKVSCIESNKLMLERRGQFYHVGQIEFNTSTNLLVMQLSSTYYV